MEGGQAAISSLLHAAASYGHLELVRELLKRGASVDLPTSLGTTALMEAAVHSTQRQRGYNPQNRNRGRGRG